MNKIILECSICQEEFDILNKKPISLNCGHTFCPSCLINLKKSLMEFICPICRVEI